MSSAVGAPVPAGKQQQLEQQQREREALFEAKHAELLSEARGVAREHGVSVHALAFRPDDGGTTAVAHELVGVPAGARRGEGERLSRMVARAVATDVSAMGAREVAAHHRQLRALRALVLRVLDDKKKDGGAGAKREAPTGQKEVDGESNKKTCRRTD